MELWKQKLSEISTDADEVSIIGEDITGVKSDNNGPDNLFYSEFKETDAEVFFDVFNRYKETYSTNRLAIDTLVNNIEEQIRAMSKRVNPTEVVLYASRCVKEQLYSNAKLITAIKSVIIPRLRYADSAKTAWYILAGWEWLAPVCVFVEAIGSSNEKDLVEMAMKYFPKFARIGSETNEKYIFKAYQKMLYSTQNTDYNKYIVDVVTNKYFVSDPDLVDDFLRGINKIDYLKCEPTYSQLLYDISMRTGLPASYRIKLGKNKPKNSEPNSKLGLLSDMNSNLDEENKQGIAQELQFGRSSRKDIMTIKNIKDANGIAIALRQVMECINDIYPEEQRGDAYVLLGTKGWGISPEVVEFLNAELEENEAYKIPIYIALQELRAMEMPVVLAAIKETPYKQFWVKNIANYCRFRTRFLGENLVPYFSKLFLDEPSNSLVVKKCLQMLNEILAKYNEGDGKLNKDNILPEAIVNMITILNGGLRSRDIYENMLDILSLLGKACPSKKSKILSQLDRMKDVTKDCSELSSIYQRINSLIITLDNIRPAE